MNIRLIFILIIAIVIVLINSDLTNGREVLFRLSLSYISSWLFYIIVVFLPKQKDKKNIDEHINLLVKDITACSESLVQILQHNSIINHHRGHQLDIENATLDDFKIMCTQLKPDLNAPIVRVIGNPTITWAEYLYDYLKSTRTIADKIFIYSSLIDSELIKILNRFLDSVCYRQLNNTFRLIEFGKSRNENLSVLAEPLFEYYQLTRELKKYLDKKTKYISFFNQ